ncbi:MAG TPA: YicC family protein [Syntrophomonadaceae bacterium]|nr:YicC family protein [Syntrophomonadaceae bacterium]
MLKSMTGFGSGKAVEAGLKVSIEIRSVNHRFCEIMVRIPRPYISLEERIKQEIQKRVVRGHLEVYVNIEDEGEKKRNVKLDKDLVIAYYNCLRELAEMLNIDFQLNVIQLAQFPDVIVVEEQEEDLEKAWAVLQKALNEALEQLVSMRVREGKRIFEDFTERKTRISEILSTIERRIPVLNQELMNRLKSRLQAMLEDAEIDEARLLSEVVLYAERSSITEEIVRLSSHLEQLTEMLHSTEPVGRRIEFLIQEMNREINTIGSKAADLVISPLVIEVKSELEKMREQVQNVE